MRKGGKDQFTLIDSFWPNAPSLFDMQSLLWWTYGVYSGRPINNGGPMEYFESSLQRVTHLRPYNSLGLVQLFIFNLF